MCDTDGLCDAKTCSSDLDCGAGQACANYGCSAGPQCVTYSDCTSTFVPTQAKRGLDVAKKRTSPVNRREKAVDLEKLLVCRRKGIQPEQCDA